MAAVSKKRAIAKAAKGESEEGITQAKIGGNEICIYLKWKGLALEEPNRTKLIVVKYDQRQARLRYYYRLSTRGRRLLKDKVLGRRPRNTRNHWFNTKY